MQNPPHHKPQAERSPTSQTNTTFKKDLTLIQLSTLSPSMATETTKRRIGRPKGSFNQSTERRTSGALALRQLKADSLDKAKAGAVQATVLAAIGFQVKDIAELLGISESLTRLRIKKGMEVADISGCLATAAVRGHRGLVDAMDFLCSLVGTIPEVVKYVDPVTGVEKITYNMTDKAIYYGIKAAQTIVDVTIGHQQRRVQAAAASKATVEGAIAASMAVQGIRDADPQTEDELTASIQHSLSLLTRHIERISSHKQIEDATFTVDQDSPASPQAQPQSHNPATLPAAAKPMGDTDPAGGEKGPSGRVAEDTGTVGKNEK